MIEQYRLAETVAARLEILGARLQDLGRVAVAVSGGVDSLTLASFARRTLGDVVTMFHAVSPAVPAPATERTRELAAREGWNLTVLDAGEFANDRYVANPVNRCFHCKTSLYDAIRPLTQGTIVAGTNLDDLGEYRPGLIAAKEHGVRHPYIEADIDKRGVRAIARHLGLGDLANLPASPCLSSRIETGIAIDPAMLGQVHESERLVDRELRSADRALPRACGGCGHRAGRGESRSAHSGATLGTEGAGAGAFRAGWFRLRRDIRAVSGGQCFPAFQATRKLVCSTR